MNRLVSATSTYLLQHKDNPVDWWPWGAEPFEEATRRDVPVLLSIGYASCHWCHVMAHESFEDPGTAQLINDRFVPVKVDREEHPEVDAVYMAATQALTGQGGWPMTCFLTPEGVPFYAGTYFPPVPAHGMPSFTQVLTAISETWREQRDSVTEAAGRIGAALAESVGAALPGGAVGGPQLERVVGALAGQFDRENAGFGRAPKFPPAMLCEFLLRHHERTGSVPALAMVDATLEAMARGGIYDQLAGGFARYSVDAHWHVPHFEKMLSDNALLLRLAAHHARLTGSARSARITDEVGRFLLSTMRTGDGLFAVALDADTDGVEGLTYRWSVEEIRRVLGADDGSRALALFGVDEGAPDPEGEVLRLAIESDDPAWYASVRARLLAARDRRPQPGRDDIVVMRDTALAATALAEAGAAFGRPEWVAAAVTAIGRLARIHGGPDGWRHSSLGGVPGPSPATLADLGCLAAAELAAYQATGEVSLLDSALATITEAGERFRADDGGWFDGSGEATGGPAIVRPRDPADGAAPSGASAITDALVTAFALTGDPSYRATAEASLSAVAAVILRFPRSAGWHLAAAEALTAGPLQIAVSLTTDGRAGPANAGPANAGPVADGAFQVRGDRAPAAADPLLAAARWSAPGGSVVDAGLPDAPGRPLLAGRPAFGAATAYVCRGFVCDAPITDPDALRAALGRV
jgi:uncharacterized protein YyaL (SSP411 family)